MSPKSRQRKKSKPPRQRYRVRTGAEVMAKFGERFNAVVDALDENWRQKGNPSFDANREHMIADGTITINDDGSETVEIPAEVAAYFKLYREMFRFKFGREPRPHDPLEFDIHAETPGPASFDTDRYIALIRKFAKEAGAPDVDAVVEHYMGRDELADYLKRRQS